MASELYFRHIIDARKHIKIYQLEKQFGRHIAYAYYFKTLELMAELSECGLKTANLQDYSEYLQIDNDTFNQFIQYCVEIDLFIDHDGLITAERLIENMQKIKSKSINMSKAAIRREKLKAKQQHNSVTILPQPEQKAETKPTKEAVSLTTEGTAIKEYLIAAKPDNIKHTINLTNNELNKLAEEFDPLFNQRLIDKLYQHYNKGKKPYKSDYLAIRQWVIKAVKEDGLLPCPPEYKRIRDNIILTDEEYKVLLPMCMNRDELEQYITQHSQTKAKYKDFSIDQDCNNLIDYINRKKHSGGDNGA